MTGLRVTGLQVRSYVFGLSVAFCLLEEMPTVCASRIDFFVQQWSCSTS